MRRRAFQRRLRDELHEARPPRAAEAERRAWARGAGGARGAGTRAAADACAAPRSRGPGGGARRSARAQPRGREGGRLDRRRGRPGAGRHSLHARLAAGATAACWWCRRAGRGSCRTTARAAASATSGTPPGRPAGSSWRRRAAASSWRSSPTATRSGPGPRPGACPRRAGRRTASGSPTGAAGTCGSRSETTAAAERLARGVGPAPPAWRPGAPSPGQVVAFSVGPADQDRRGGHAAARRQPPRRGPVPRELWWTADGRRLRGGLVRVRSGCTTGAAACSAGCRCPPGVRATGSALDTAGRRLAVAAEETRPARERGARVQARRGAAATDGPPADRLYAGPGSIEGLTWSIDGRVLVLGLPEADQWLLVRPRARAAAERGVRGSGEWFAGGSGAAARATAPVPTPGGLVLRGASGALGEPAPRRARRAPRRRDG